MSNQSEIINAAQIFLQEKFGDESTGHDYWHAYRVWKIAKYIAQRETNSNKFVVELAALLHDIADWKEHDGNEEVGPRAARDWLKSQQADDKTITHVESIIRSISFRGACVPQEIYCLEGKIVHDADKLDAIGAIGIARVFAYCGAKGRLIHDPQSKVELHRTFEEYSNNKSTAINHFYEKLLLIKNRMQTKTGRKLAAGRHKLMSHYLDNFLQEWDGP